VDTQFAKIVLTAFATAWLTAEARAQVTPQDEPEAVHTDAMIEAEEGCRTHPTDEQWEVARLLQSIGAYDLPSSAPRYLLEAPMTMHVVRQNNGTGGISQADIDQTVADANVHYAAAGMRFAQSGPTLFIDDTNFYFNIDTQAEADALRQVDVVEGTINVYFTQNLATEEDPDGLCGQSTFTFTEVQGVIMTNGCTAMNGNTSTFAHEVGHYFDLYHTYANGDECPDGSNCTTAGDLLCDTPADPGLNSENVLDCVYFGTATRCGDPFDPDPRNFMTNGSVRACRDRFSPQQLNKALATLISLRSDLIEAPGLNVTWADFAYGGVEQGTYARPYNDLPTALSHTAAGGIIVIKAGSSPAPITLNSAVRLDSFRGTATIGG
jgi:hypothetical protein